MKHVLVVDDDPEILEAIAELLETTYLVTLAPNGERALALLDQAQVDVAVVDLMMPVLDGAGFVRALKARGLEIPVILASASTDLPERARELNAAGMLHKPFDAGTLEQKLQDVLGG